MIVISIRGVNFIGNIARENLVDLGAEERIEGEAEAREEDREEEEERNDFRHRLLDHAHQVLDTYMTPLNYMSSAPVITGQLLNSMRVSPRYKARIALSKCVCPV